MTASVILMLSILALNNAIVTLAPSYSLFGSQTYIPENVTHASPEPCSVNAPESSGCLTTQLGEIVNGININVGFFGMIFYAFTWLFFLAFLVSIVVAACRARSSNIDYYSEDEEEEER